METLDQLAPLVLMEPLVQLDLQEPQVLMEQME
jgi:hypothetical protein